MKSELGAESTMFLVSSFFHSGGVMIYFDRIEVVNMLVPSAGIEHVYTKSNFNYFLTFTLKDPLFYHQVRCGLAMIT